jgi:hypothetical protein
MTEAKETNQGAIFGAHVWHEFVDHDVTATMETMTADPYVHNVPTLTGGDGHAGVVDFYTHHFVGKMPPDTRIGQNPAHSGQRPSGRRAHLVFHARPSHRLHASRYCAVTTL